MYDTHSFATSTHLQLDDQTSTLRWQNQSLSSQRDRLTRDLAISQEKVWIDRGNDLQIAALVRYETSYIVEKKTKLKKNFSS